MTSAASPPLPATSVGLLAGQQGDGATGSSEYSPSSSSEERSGGNTPLSAELRNEWMIEYCGDACWILSEVGWILLVPVVCIPPGVMAFVLHGAAAVRSCLEAGWRRPEDWLPSVIQTYWLLVNFVWMLEEVLWYSPDQPTPWNLTPMLWEDLSLYNRIERYCSWCFLSTLGIWLAGMAYIAWSKSFRVGGGHTAATAHGLARALFCESGFVVSWAVTDGFWAAETLWPSVVCCFLTIGLIAVYAAWETGAGVWGADRTDAVWVLWTLANLLWIVCEIQFDEDLSWRYAAASLGTVALALLLCSFRQARARSSARAIQKNLLPVEPPAREDAVAS